MDKDMPGAREAVEIGKIIADAIRKTDPKYPKRAIETVTKIVYRQLRKEGYDSSQLMVIASAILQSVAEELKREREKDEA